MRFSTRINLLLVGIAVAFFSLERKTHGGEADEKHALSDLLEHYQQQAVKSSRQAQLSLKFSSDKSFLTEKVELTSEGKALSSSSLEAWVQDEELRIVGLSYPAVRVEPQNPFRPKPLIPSFGTGYLKQDGFRQAIQNRFGEVAIVPARQPYTLVSNNKRLTQYWRARDQHYPAAMIMECENLLESTLPVEYVLVMLMIHPERFLHAAFQKTSPGSFWEQPARGSQPLKIFATLPTGTDPQSRRAMIFFDVKSGVRLTRLIIPEEGKFRQYDLSYQSSGEFSTVPNRCSVYAESDDGDALGFAQIHRIEMANLPEQQAILPLEFSPGTFVVDATIPQRSIVQADGSWTAVNSLHLFETDITHDKLIHVDHRPPSRPSLLDNPEISRRQTLLSYLRWPWNLVIIGVLSACGYAVRRLYRTFHPSLS
jgi:hypothetical protein